MTNQFGPFGKWIAGYFRTYGGWTAVAQSPLFQIAFIITALNYTKWFHEDWVELALTLLPTLLGFSLGTYAILFSLLGDKLKEALSAARDKNGTSRLTEVNTTFFHFIFIQVLAIVWAFIFSGSSLVDLVDALKASWPSVVSIYRIVYLIGSFSGYLLMLYSVLLTLGAAMAVYRLALLKTPKDPPPSTDA
ncbi:hypothetical protein NKI56_32080 [Mesorhizobium sp. M0622]|uniref:hypothetical protein n=1 Tax=Mesorhizobium sp. M0622 TaxID=2956975 RepID=UPI00333DC88A